MNNVNMSKICTDCSGQIEESQKDSLLCLNCRRIYDKEIRSMNYKAENDLIHSVIAFFCKSIIALILVIVVLFIATRFEFHRSDTYLELLCTYNGGNYNADAYNAKCRFVYNGNVSTTLGTGILEDKLKIEIYEGR
jgi:hypothetical protein